MARTRITWKDRVCGYETPQEQFLRHNGLFKINKSRCGNKRRKDRVLENTETKIA